MTALMQRGWIVRKRQLAAAGSYGVLHVVRRHQGEFIPGEIFLPPAHSAIKIGGQRAYDLARQGKEVKLRARNVEIKEFEITSIQLPAVQFRVVCSKGTYIRSLANDFGEKLGVGGYLSELCRTRIGTFKLEDALTVEEV